MLARYKGTCKACGKSIEVGQEITWNRAIKGSTRHADCSGIRYADSSDAGVLLAHVAPASATLEAKLDVMDRASTRKLDCIDCGCGGGEHKDECRFKDVPVDAPVAVASAPLEAKLDVMDGTSHISELAEKIRARENFVDVIEESAKVEVKAKRTRKPKVDIVSKASDALSRVPQNAAWYDVLTAILPHVSRVLLVGPPATGKSTTAMKVAGCKYRVTMTETTSREDLIGMFHLIDGETKWIDGPVTSAMRNGEPILVDEIDRYSPEAASLLYALIDDKPHLSLPNGDMLYASDGYKMIMTSNEGLDTLPEAVQDRIECILMASEPHEDAISDLPEALRNVTTCYYRSLSKVSIKLPTTVRRMKTLNLLLTNGLNPKLAASIVFGQHAEILSVLASMENSVSA